MFRFSIRELVLVMVIVAMGLGWCLDGLRWRNAQATAKHTWIVVFRHHPGLIDTEEPMAFRDRDAKALVKAAQDGCTGCRYEGGMGRGYELSVLVSELGEWKSAVDKLIVGGTLEHYRQWGLDRAGYGLVPVR